MAPSADPVQRHHASAMQVIVARLTCNGSQQRARDGACNRCPQWMHAKGAQRREEKREEGMQRKWKEWERKERTQKTRKRREEQNFKNHHLTKLK